MSRSKTEWDGARERVLGAMFRYGDSSPVVTPAQMAAALTALMAELEGMLQVIVAGRQTGAEVQGKKYMTVSELAKVTGFSRKTVYDVLARHGGHISKVCSLGENGRCRYNRREFEEACRV